MVQANTVDLETKVNKVDIRNRKVLKWVRYGAPIGVLIGVIAWGLGYKLSNDSNEEVKANLAPNAVFIKYSLSGVNNFIVKGQNKDVNSDGKYESVLEYINPINGLSEARLIERDSDKLQLRRFEVVNGEIRYLVEF